MQFHFLFFFFLIFFLIFFLLSVTEKKKIYQRADTDFLNDSLKFILYIILIFFTSTSPSIVIILKSHFHTMKCVQILSLIIIVSFPMKPTSFPQTFPQPPIFLIKSPLYGNWASFLPAYLKTVTHLTISAIT